MDTVLYFVDAPPVRLPFSLTFQSLDQFPFREEDPSEKWPFYTWEWERAYVRKELTRAAIDADD